MELIGLISALKDFYVQQLGREPHKITMGRYWYEHARERGTVQTSEPWRDHRGYILGMKIDVDPRDDYKLAVEDYRRYQDRAQYRFDMRD